VALAIGPTKIEKIFNRICIYYNIASNMVKKTNAVKKVKIQDADETLNLKREKTMESMSEFGRSADFTNATFRQLSSTLKLHVSNPAEIHTEIDRKIYIIPANKRRTSEIMSEFEYTRVVSERAQHIQNGAQIFVDVDPLMNEIEIAKLEIKMRCCPLAIRRMHNERVGEEWSVNEMEIPFQ
jgi:DNA-directed RNA polymerase subunit K/omega